MKTIHYSLVFLLSITLTPFIKTDIPAEQTYGLYDAIEDNYKHLSPTHGFVASNQQTFEGYYNFTQPSEPLHKLMHELFRSFDNSLKPHASMTQVGTYLDAATIGKLLATIEKYLKNNIIIINKKDLEKEILEVIKSNEHLKKRKAKILQDFVQALTDSLEQVGHWDPKGKHYPQFIVHDMLLTLLFKKVNDKSEYKNYFSQFNNLNGGKGTLKPNADELLNKSYEDPADPTTMAKNILANQPAVKAMFDYVLQHYDSIAFATIKLGAHQVGYPPQVPQSTVLLSWYQTNPLVVQKNLNQNELLTEYGFSDCMEIALLNLLIFTEYDQEKNRFKGSIKYFKEFDVQTITSEPARIAWADLVSNIPQAKYVKRVKVEKSTENKSFLIIENAKDNNSNIPWIRHIEPDGWYYYELKSGLDNIVFVVNNIYNLQLKDFDSFLTHFNLGCPSQKVVEEETICTMTDQDKKNCVLHYKPGHAYIAEYPRGKLIEAMSNFVSEIFALWTGSYYLPVLNLYRVNLQNIPIAHVKKELQESILLRHAFLLQQLSDNEVKISILSFIMSTAKLHLIQQGTLHPWALSDWYKHFITQLINQLLSLNDPQMTNRVLMLWAANAPSLPMVPGFIITFKKSKHLLTAQEITDILKRLILNKRYPTESDKKMIHNFIMEQAKADPDLQYELVGESKDGDPGLHKALFDLYLSEIEINLESLKNPAAMVGVLLENGPDVGLSKEKAQAIINKILPRIEQLGQSEIDNFALITLYHRFLGIEYVKEILLRLFPKMNSSLSRLVLSGLKKDVDLWGQDFIDQLEANKIKTSATQ